MVKQTPSIILGIDPGIADTGVGVIKKDGQGNLSCLYYSSIKTKSSVDLGDRLEVIEREIKKIIRKYKPGIIAVEQIFFCKNVKTALIVGHARGVILLTAKQSKVPILEFTPLEVKQAVTSYGQADKTQVQKMVRLILNLKEIPKPDDAADALAIAICASNIRL